MNSQKRSSTMMLNALATIFLLFSRIAFAQLFVVAITPADGSTNVPTEVTIEVEFSAPLDTNAQFPPDYRHFLSLLITQDHVIEEPDSITITSDLKTVRYHNYKIAADAKFIFGVLAARGINGESLDLPAIVTFSTRATIPSASVAGRVTLAGGNPRGSLVSLIAHPYFSFQGDFCAVAVVNQSTGEYTIPYVDEGSHYPVASKDTSGDGFPDIVEMSEPVGFYDPNHDTVPDSIIVAEGQSLTGVDMTLSQLAPFTASSDRPPHPWWAQH